MPTNISLSSVSAIALLLFSTLPQASPIPSISGMAKINSETYLAVTDKKAHKKGVRVGILQFNKGAPPQFQPLTDIDWISADGKANDLESVCPYPRKENEYLLAESGYWKGKYGRIFHVTLNNRTLTVLNIYKVPQTIESVSGKNGDNYEGIVCFEKGKTLYVVLGERGGSLFHRNGYLRVGALDQKSNKIDWLTRWEQPIEIIAPSNWNHNKSNRSISDLYLDEDGIIWAVATEDSGDNGPFRSIIYKAAKIPFINPWKPLIKVKHPTAHRVIDGFKIEALSTPLNSIQKSHMLFCTDDETYGGTCRPLF